MTMHKLDHVAGPDRGRLSPNLSSDPERAADVVARQAARPGGLPSELATASASGGRPLDVATREHMAKFVDTDLSKVRVYSDSRARMMADGVGAEALTIGRNVYFGSGSLEAGSQGSDALLAHELAHVGQQARYGAAIQPKLKFTGTPADRARAIALLNSGMSLHAVSAAGDGSLSIKTIGEGPPAPTEQALTERLTTVIQDPHDVLMTVSAGSKTLGGSYATGDFDIADLEVYGIGGLIHEIEEQYQKQKNGMAFGGDATGAHSKAIDAESAVTGGKRGAQKVVSSSVNGDGTLNAVIEIPFTFPGGVIKTLKMTVTSNNIVSKTWI